jgi:tRNA (cmo5U34)-methyltransferase
MAAHDVRGHFDRDWEEYDTRIRRLVPRYDDLHEAILSVLPLDPEAKGRVLDLGMGTGELTRKVLDRFPRADVVGIDFAGRLLDGARRKLAGYGDRVVCLEGDYEEMEAPGTFDAAVSALSIHHLDGEAKRRLFGRIHAKLRPGGAFVNGDYVEPASPRLRDRYRELREAYLRAAGWSEDEIAKHRENSLRYDRPSTVEDQLAWLRDLGYEDVDCVWKFYDLAVFVGHRRA